MTQPEDAPSRSARRHDAVARRRRVFLIGGAVVAVVALAVAAVLTFAGSDDDGDDTATGSGEATATTSAGAGTQDTGATTTTANEAKPLASGVCSADQISGAQSSSGVRGTRQVAVLVFTNGSQRSCVVNGSVAIGLVTSSGSQPATVTTGGEGINPALAAQEIELAPGAQASMVMSFAPVAGPGDPGCVRATAMQVTLPASKGTVDVSGLVTVCGGGAIAVSPLQPGVVTA
jgi:hypothetical protein